jgi:hypothetical protein
MRFLILLVGNGIEIVIIKLHWNRNRILQFFLLDYNQNHYQKISSRIGSFNHNQNETYI